MDKLIHILKPKMLLFEKILEILVFPVLRIERIICNSQFLIESIELKESTMALLGLEALQKLQLLPLKCFSDRLRETFLTPVRPSLLGF